MSSDYSRKSFDPKRNYSGVGMQQGRVQLDADWNEQGDIQDRRWRAETVDVVGRCGCPHETPDAFRIRNDSGSLTIGVGRMYVDGLLAENHGVVPAPGDPPPPFNRILAEEEGSGPLPFSGQPYLPDAEDLLPDAPGPVLVYLDVWHREVTYLEDPDLVEKAVGVDTTTRQQTVWQVKLLTGVGAISCETPDAGVNGWLDLIAPSAGRLSSEPVGIADPTDPCRIPPSGGYKGLENRLYRVEIHDGGSPGPATFKWSRYNGTIATRVTAIPELDTLKVERTGRDDVLRFNAGDWVEVIDDHLELGGQPGVIRRVDSVDDATRTISLREALPAGVFPTDAQGLTLGGRHTRVRRWDQSGVVRDTDGNLLEDLDDPTSVGVIPVPADGTSVVLEDGVQITFSSEPTGAAVRPRDYWCFAARATDASLEELVNAPPRDIHHHFCRLAIADFDGEEFVGEPTDCRDCFPPLTDLQAGCCTVVVQPGEDIQAAIDSLPEEGGCVCIKTGLHTITAPLLIERSNVVIHGESPGSRIRRDNGITVVAIDSPTGARLDNVCLERLRFEISGEASQAGELAIIFTDLCSDLCVRDCEIATDEFAQVVGVRIGSVLGALVERCEIGRVALGVWVDTDSTALAILDNTITGAFSDGADLGGIGIWMEDAFGASRIERNEIREFVSGIYLNSSAFDQRPTSGAAGTVILGNRVERSSRAGEAGEHRIFGIDVAAWNCLVRDNALSYSSPAYGGIRLTGPGGSIENNRLFSGFSAVAGEAQVPPIGIQVGFVTSDVSLSAEGGLIRANRLRGRQDAIVMLEARGARVVENDIRGAELPVRNAALLSNVDHTQFVGNRIAGADAGVVLVGGEANRVSGNTLQDGGTGIAAGQETALSVTQNRVENMRVAGLLALQLAGTTQVSENRFVSCGFEGIPGLGAFSIGVVVALGDLHIDSCEVINTGVAQDESAIVQPAYGIVAIYVLECLVQGNLVTYTNPFLEGRDPAAEDRALRLQGWLELQLTDLLSLGYAAQVVDNKFTGPGASSLIDFLEQQISDRFFLRFERVTFSNNFCWHLSSQSSATTGTVSLNGRSAIVMGNHVKAITRIPSFDFNNMRGIYIGNDVDVPPVAFVEFPSPASAFNR